MAFCVKMNLICLKYSLVDYNISDDFITKHSKRSKIFFALTVPDFKTFGSHFECYNTFVAKLIY
jgi:hypothetical protein